MSSGQPLRMQLPGLSGRVLRQQTLGATKTRFRPTNLATLSASMCLVRLTLPDGST